MNIKKEEIAIRKYITRNEKERREERKKTNRNERKTAIAIERIQERNTGKEIKKE